MKWLGPVRCPECDRRMVTDGKVRTCQVCHHTQPVSYESDAGKEAVKRYRRLFAKEKSEQDAP